MATTIYSSYREPVEYDDCTPSGRYISELEDELNDVYEKMDYEVYIRSKYPAVAEAYKTYETLLALAQENESTPNIAKAA